MFGYGASHGIHAQFIAQSAPHHNGKRIGLLRGAGTRFSTFFYAIIRAICCRLALIETIHQAKFSELDLNEYVRSAVLDIEDKNFRKAIYTIVRATFPALRSLRYCERNTPTMEKLFHLSHRTTIAMKRLCDCLNDADLFGIYNGTNDLLELE